MPELYSSMQNIERARRNLALDRYPRPLDLLASFRIFQATDARDKVFGLYSLINPSDLAVLELQPDYSLDVIKVFTRAAMDYCLADHAKLPTWVPDWSYRDRTKSLLMQRFLTDSSPSERNPWPCTWKSATGSSYPVVEIAKEADDDDDGFISISGGGILKKEYYDSQPGLPALEINQHSHAEMRRGSRKVGTSERRERQHPISHRRVSMGCILEDLPRRQLHTRRRAKHNAFEKWYQHFRESLTLSNLGGDAVEEIENSDAGTLSKILAGVGMVGKLTYKASKMGWNMYSSERKIPPSRIAAFHRVILKTGQGHIGISSKHIREGDTIALFQGGKLPLVIREVEEGGGGS
ncbi:hypothetical protein DL95DRAFT_475152 [Leptodontidium sp. 2 PMI_412]|nr:hypothetical protein DL95DRAFT_475152 [Leptodontidium sp. 2 PMI_412]